MKKICNAISAIMIVVGVITLTGIVNEIELPLLLLSLIYAHLVLLFIAVLRFRRRLERLVSLKEAQI